MNFINKKGMVLIIVLSFAMLFMLAATSFVAINSSEIQMVRLQNDSTRALYLAEAGAQQVAAQLKNNSDYRDNPAQMNVDLGGGSYLATVVKNGDTYTITSAGTMGKAARTVGQIAVAVVPDAPWSSVFTDYTLFGNGGGMNLRMDGSVDGSIFQYGDIDIRSGTTISGTVYATGIVDDVDGTNDVADTLPDPLPTMPQLYTETYFDPLIANAALSGTGDQAYANLDLSAEGGTVEISGNASIDSGGSITGPGTLIVAGNVDINQNASVGNDVTIISGGLLDIMKNSSVGTNCTLYAPNVDINKEGIVVNGGCILTPGNIDIDKALTFSGIMYSGGEITFDKAANLNVRVVAEDGVYVKKDCVIQDLDLANFPARPPGLEGGEVDAEVTFSAWKEEFE